MPALPIQQIQARGPVPEVSAEIGSGGAGAVASGIAGLVASGIGQIQRANEEERRAREIAQRRQQANEADVQIINAQSRVQAQIQQRMTELENSDGGLSGATEAILKDFDELVQQEQQGANSLAKAGMATAFARMRGQVNEQIYGAEMKFRNGQLVKDFSAGVDEDQRLVYANPAAFTEALARRRSLAESLALPAQVKTDLARGATQQIALSAATGLAERSPQELLDRASAGDPQKFAAAVKNDPLLSSLSPEGLNQALRMAQTELNRRSSEDRYNIVSQTKDVQAMVMQGVTPPAGSAPTVEQYTKAFGPSGAARWQDEVGNYLQIGGAIAQMRTATPEERVALIAAAAPTPGAGFAGGLQMRDALVQAKQIVDRQIVADPAQYALTNSPRVQQSYAVMQRVLNDPKMGAEDRAAAVDFYARTTEAEQIRLGINTIRDETAGNKIRGPKLLNNAKANAISDQFNNQTTGGANAAQLVQGLEQQWGKYWPTVYGQLAQDNKLPPAALVIPNMPNDASRARMAAVSAMKPDDLKALVAPADLKDINEAIRSEFDQAQRTFTAQGTGGNRTLATVIESAEKLATLYRSQGQSAKSAARQAFTETMGHAYQFGDTYRVPIAFNLSQVRRGADAAVEQLIKQGGYTIFTGAAPQVITEDALRNRAMWINTDDESGLFLKLRGADGGVYDVIGKNGAPVRSSWSDLTTQAAQARAADKTPEGNEEWLRRRQQELNPRR